MTIAHLSPPEPGVAPKYPWSEWLDGRRWVLARGRDYWDDNAAMRRKVQSSANARRLRVVIDGSDPNRLIIKAIHAQPVESVDEQEAPRAS